VRIARLTAAAVALLLAIAPAGARAEFKLVDEIGAASGGELVTPIDVERDNAGNTYAVDALTARVVKYDAADNFVTSWGGRGSGPGQFSTPFAIGVNEATGESYVADLDESNPVALGVRIERFDANGTFLGQFGSFGTAAGQFGVIQGIAVQPGTGDVFVAESNRVQRLNSTGGFELMWGKDVVPGGATGPETCAAACKEGEPGDAAGELRGPAGIAVTGASVYVTEDGNSRVSRFNAATGAFQIMAGADVQPGGAMVGETCVAACQAGLRGTGPSEFDEPRGIDVNNAFGFVFVVDADNHRVQRLSGGLGYVSEFGAEGTGDGQFVAPRGVTENQGTVIVADGGLPRLQSFTGLGAFQDRFGDPQPGTMVLPFGLAVGPGGVYVTDRLDRVLRYDNAGGFISRFGSTNAPPGGGAPLAGIGIGPDGNVYVVDQSNDRVAWFDSAGNALGAFGSSGAGDGQFDFPADVAVGPDGTVFVLDGAINGRVQRFSPIGDFEGTWGAPGDAPGQFNGARGIATDSKGSVYVADSSNDRVQKFDPQGTLLAGWGTTGSGDGEFDSPGDLAIDGAGNVYVADSGNNRVQRFEADGKFSGRFGANGGDGTIGAGPGEFNQPSSVAVDADGYIYVLDTFNSRVQKFAATPELKLKAKKRQKLKRLKVKVTCQSGPCNVRVTGKGKVGDLKLKLMAKRAQLGAGERTKLKLKAKRAGKARALLAGGAQAKLTVKATATNEAGKAKAKRKLKLRAPGP